MLEIGSKAPTFKLNDSKGKTVSLGDFKGKQVVIYFYPKDDTPGCTIEAKEFTDLLPNFKKKNAVVIGISKDSTESHDKFICKYELKLTLLSDPEHETIEAYGAWQEKKNYGKIYMGIVRTTYLIDGKGKIKKVWEEVKAFGHAKEVLENL
ncbi:thioredoxin-dependent thiol peroxidase [Fibrobacterota bacterium]